MPNGRDELLAIAEVLKNRFPNLSTKETIALAFDILEAVRVVQAAQVQK